MGGRSGAREALCGAFRRGPPLRGPSLLQHRRDPLRGREVRMILSAALVLCAGECGHGDSVIATTIRFHCRSSATARGSTERGKRKPTRGTHRTRLALGDGRRRVKRSRGDGLRRRLEVCFHVRQGLGGYGANNASARLDRLEDDVGGRRSKHRPVGEGIHGQLPRVACLLCKGRLRDESEVGENKEQGAGGGCSTGRIGRTEGSREGRVQGRWMCSVAVRGASSSVHSPRTEPREECRVNVASTVSAPRLPGDAPLPSIAGWT